ncbi:hypothetical protein AI2983V1_3240 [Enterobacter cloacae]|nr:hypothetical protein AI2983V1_3240 [Enterobacter cloacae]CAH5676748.1 hypothetical protein AI2983V1_3240 [Enterobacter cloacae]
MALKSCVLLSTRRNTTCNTLANSKNLDHRVNHGMPSQRYGPNRSEKRNQHFLTHNTMHA